MARKDLFQSLGDSRIVSPFGKCVGDAEVDINAAEDINFKERIIYGDIEMD